MRKSVLLLISLLLAVWLPGCTAKPQEFKSAAGRFAVTTPKTLQESTQDVETQGGKIDLYLFSTQQDNIGYFVSYCDYSPEIMVHSDLEKMLDGSRDGAVGNTKGKLLSETKITLADYPGRELVIETTDESGRRRPSKGACSWSRIVSIRSWWWRPGVRRAIKKLTTFCSPSNCWGHRDKRLGRHCQN